MIWIILFPIGVLVIALHDSIHDPWIWNSGNWGLIAGDFVVTGIGMVLAAVLGAGLAALIGSGFPSHSVEVRRVTLMAIRDKDGVSGQFFLGSGFIKSDPYYFYYEQMVDGGFRPAKVEVSSGVRVYEEDRKDAQLVKFEWVVDNTLAMIIALPVNSGGYSYDFHVPKGTIRQGYTM